MSVMFSFVLHLIYWLSGVSMKIDFCERMCFGYKLIVPCYFALDVFSNLYFHSVTLLHGWNNTS